MDCKDRELDLAASVTGHLRVGENWYEKIRNNFKHLKN